MAEKMTQQQSWFSGGQAPFFSHWGDKAQDWDLSMGLESYLRQIQAALHQMSQAVGRSSDGQIDDLFTVNRRLARAMTRLAQSRTPKDLITAQAQMTDTVFEGATHSARLWSEAFQRMQECCQAMIEATETEARDYGARAGKAAREIPVEIASKSAQAAKMGASTAKRVARRTKKAKSTMTRGAKAASQSRGTTETKH